MNYALKHYLLSKTRTYEQNTKGKRKNSMNFEKNKNIISPPIRRSCSGGGGGFGPRSPHQSRRQVPGTSAGMTEVSGEPAALGTLPESDRDWEMRQSSSPSLTPAGFPSRSPQWPLHSCQQMSPGHRPLPPQPSYSRSTPPCPKHVSVKKKKKKKKFHIHYKSFS